MAIALIIVGPSGAGKDTLARKLRERRPELALSVSCTTRPPRYGEKDGQDYIFMTPERFEQTVRENGFLEWAEVHGNRYGTLAAQVREHLDAGQDMLFVVDIQGARHLRDAFAAHGIPCHRVFVSPPSMDALILRMRRLGENEESIGRRMADVEAEMAAKDEYDTVLVNDDLDATVDALEKAYLAAR